MQGSSHHCNNPAGRKTTHQVRAPWRGERSTQSTGNPERQACRPGCGLSRGLVRGTDPQGLSPSSGTISVAFWSPCQTGGHVSGGWGGGPETKMLSPAALHACSLNCFRVIPRLHPRRPQDCSSWLTRAGGKGDGTAHPLHPGQACGHGTRPLWTAGEPMGPQWEPKPHGRHGTDDARNEPGCVARLSVQAPDDPSGARELSRHHCGAWRKARPSRAEARPGGRGAAGRFRRGCTARSSDLCPTPEVAPRARFAVR